MKRKDRGSEQFGGKEWIGLVLTCFPELTVPAELSCASVTDELEFLASIADRSGNGPQAASVYNFVRWSLQNASEEVRTVLANRFFTGILPASASDTKCLDRFDWGDVRIFISAWSTDPHIENPEHFEALCDAWQKRWSRHGHLPPPRDPREMIGLDDEMSQ